MYNEFKFNKYYYEAICNLPKENRLEVYEMILEYAFNFKELEKMSDLTRAFYIIVSEDIDKNRNDIFDKIPKLRKEVK